ncbi:MAG: DNA cytosine methyltransferase, partial [Bacilli bacterium]|nr:DNA cytosine methyltransferase [Bacilli bacterium]
LDDFNHSYATFGDVQEQGLETVNSFFTQKVLDHFEPKNLYGKSIKDKRGGVNNIHSWELGLKGEITKVQQKLLSKLLRERRKKQWAEIIGITWMDGMPLTTQQISTFFNVVNLQEILDDLVKKGYLVYEHPKELYGNQRKYDTTKPKGYNIVTGKLSFEFTRFLDPNDITPTLVATDVSKLGVIDNNGIRELSVREGLRLFGFPENFSLDFLKKSESFDLLGNTVCIPVIKEISLKLLDNYAF